MTYLVHGVRIAASSRSHLWFQGTASETAGSTTNAELGAAVRRHDRDISGTGNEYFPVVMTFAYDRFQI